MMTLKNILLSANPSETLREMMNDGTLREFEPALANLRMTIPQGFHHKDNFEHSLKVLDNAINREENGPDLILRAAALFHDIGKPATRKFGARKDVTFDGHEIVGASITHKVLTKHHFTKNEIREISLIVRLHMRSHGFTENDWTDSAIRRLIHDTGNIDTLHRLIIVFYADSTTANTKKLIAHRHVIDRLSEEINSVMKADERKRMRPALNGNEVMEIFHLEPGPELGRIMKFLNSDDGIMLSRENALKAIEKRITEND